MPTHRYRQILGVVGAVLAVCVLAYVAWFAFPLLTIVGVETGFEVGTWGVVGLDISEMLANWWPPAQPLPSLLPYVAPTSAVYVVALVVGWSIVMAAQRRVAPGLLHRMAVEVVYALHLAMLTMAVLGYLGENDAYAVVLAGWTCVGEAANWAWWWRDGQLLPALWLYAGITVLTAVVLRLASVRPERAAGLLVALALIGLAIAFYPTVRTILLVGDLYEARDGTVIDVLRYVAIHRGWYMSMVFSSAVALGASVMLWHLLWVRSAPVLVNVCSTCGYDLRGSRGPRCPECGAGIGERGEETQRQ